MKSDTCILRNNLLVDNFCKYSISMKSLMIQRETSWFSFSLAHKHLYTNTETYQHTHSN